jgi:hypothetical protein
MLPWGRAKLVKLDEHASDALREWCAGTRLCTLMFVHGQKEFGLIVETGYY